MDIYDPISKVLGIEPILLDKNFYNIPEESKNNKWGGSVKGKKHAARGHGRPKGSFDDYIFVTNGIIEKIVHKDKIPEGMKPGRLRVCNKPKPIVIDGVEYESGKAAAKALNISNAMVTYLRIKQRTGKAPW